MPVRIKDVLNIPEHFCIYRHGKKMPLVEIGRTLEPRINHQRGIARIDIKTGMADIFNMHERELMFERRKIDFIVEVYLLLFRISTSKR